MVCNQLSSFPDSVPPASLEHWPHPYFGCWRSFGRWSCRRPGPSFFVVLARTCSETSFEFRERRFSSHPRPTRQKNFRPPVGRWLGLLSRDLGAASASYTATTVGNAAWRIEASGGL